MLKIVMTVSTLLLLLDFPAVGQTEYTDRWEDHYQLSTEIIASETGTSFIALESFYEAMSAVISSDGCES